MTGVPTVDTAAPATGSPARPSEPGSVLRPPRWRRTTPWLLLVLAVVAGFGLQTQLYTGQERTASTILMFVSLAVAWNLIGGYAGYACFGQVGFFGLGGYTTAVLMTHARLSFWLALPASAVLVGVFAALIGAPLLRLRGHYFAVAMLGVAEGLREVVTNVPGLTGGGAGITVPTVDAGAPTRWLGNDGFYVLFLLLAGVLVGVGLLVSTSRAGYALRAINQDEDAAAAMGINTTVAKTMALAVSAALTGAVGAAYAFQQVTIYPERLFDVDITVLMVVMVMLGGAGTVIGPVIGAVAVAFASEWLRQHYPLVHTFLLGGLIIAAVILLPQGFTTYVHDAVRTRRFSPLANLRRYRL
ncbi:branched-chain amino acid ABC transporter permease [Rugosimonospora africana]|uniref:Branched-chain amino acid ABC transporter permease n=1 Tax=Rugosimonospora africana TaxID=556532 RepID=A0A8J3VPC3_9ACTN|nr:branched-chain amino acid ABC transporter permease [Rugosimonospora africana]GIH13989.1 branched-chain amino acid ABC transporter permease [Rugosimonospora africana]